MRAFNLIDEPWIMVRCRDGKVKSVSLKETLLSSHTFSGLAGETKTQDFALFRLMLAVLYTVFSRYDFDGQEIEADDMQEFALDCWKEIWDTGKLPAAPIERYLTEWHERFWLFDDEFPFYQTKAVEDRKECSTAKLIGTLFESDNKTRLFSDRSPEGRNLSFAEAARWLVNLNQFDDIASKPTPKQTWCGKLSMIALIGDSLFQTLMLNYRADYDATREKAELPAWETDRRQITFNQQIAVPDNQAALLTLQSRNLLLCVKNGMVCAFKQIGGDWFEEEAVFDEQMTLWSGYQDKKAPHPEFKPKRYDSTKLIWQEFPSISALAVTQKDTGHCIRPVGIVEWLNDLLKYGFLSDNYVVKICNAAVIYNHGQPASRPVMDAVSDSVSFHAKLLEDIGSAWRRKIIEEIGKSEKAAHDVYVLCQNLQRACGKMKTDPKKKEIIEQEKRDAKREYYARIDRPFRLWLADLDPESDREEYAGKLEYILRRTAISLGRELAGQIGAQAIFGSSIMSSAQALNIFEGAVNKLFVAAKEYQPEVKEIEQT
ncbi:MAG TPA: type I-E CRISPR-associated protein Cse1/CasA [Ruminococcus sp.]|nr:type I-E CRISPR-associated protein Cse1/CasA [Ruminococcus sp.]